MDKIDLETLREQSNRYVVGIESSFTGDDVIDIHTIQYHVITIEKALEQALEQKHEMIVIESLALELEELKAPDH